MFRIRALVISDQQEDHIWTKHQVTPRDVDEVCGSARFVLKGRDGSFAIYGQTDAGRYLVVFVYPRVGGVFHLATARDVTQTERRRIQHLPERDLYE